MPRPILTPEQFDAELAKHNGNAYAMAKATGIAHSSIRRRIVRATKAKAEGKTGLPTQYPVGQEHRPKPELPAFPDDDIPTDELIDLMERRFTKRFERAKAERWFRVTMPDNQPFALCFFGDPHVDSNGCNWPLLREHIRTVSNTPGMYGANVGDLTDNWVGRLQRLYADSDQSAGTGWKLAKWFLTESGVDWLVHVLGNHDQWNRGGDLIRAFVGTKVPVLDDEARFILQTPNGTEYPIWVRHQFVGNSMWNTLHGMQRTAHTKEAAALYICGHLHNWALHEEESASRGHVYWLARARGYKYLDAHQTALGHAAQEYGASIVAVFNPRATRLPQRLRCIPDVDEAADYLTYLRKRKAA